MKGNRMIQGKRLNVWVLGTSLLLTGAIVVAQDRPTTAPSTRPSAPPRGSGPNLEASMKTMGQSFKQLKAQVNDASQNKSSLAALLQMEQATISAKAQPPGLRRVSEEERAKKQADFRSSLINLLRLELDLEEHLLANETAKAAEILTTMDDVMKQGHEEFNVKVKKDE